MSLARAQTRTARSGDERTNHEAIAPKTERNAPERNATQRNTTQRNATALKKNLLKWLIEMLDQNVIPFETASDFVFFFKCDLH